LPLLSEIDQSEIAAKIEVSRETAYKVALVHVDRRLVELVDIPPHEIPVSSDQNRSSNTRRVERMLGLPASAYFYAGRASPQFGSTAFAFGPECENAHTGSASPFDTGGLLSNPPHLNLRLSPTDGEEERVGFGQVSLLPLTEWRETFGTFLAAYFDKDVDFWRKNPNRSDPEKLFELNSDWRAWTFEIRFSEGLSITQRAAWCADEAVMSQLRRIDDQQPAGIPGEPSALDLFFAGPPALEPQGTPFFCNRIERWVQEQIEA